MTYVEKQNQLWSKLIDIIRNTLQVKFQDIDQLNNTLIHATPLEGEILLKIYAPKDLKIDGATLSQ